MAKINFKAQATEEVVLDYPKFNVNNSGKPIPSPHNVVLILESFEKEFSFLGYNEFAHSIEKLHESPWDTPKGEWDDDDTSLFSVFIDKNFQFTPKKEHIENAVLEVARRSKFNPVKQRIESVEWDGVERVSKFFHNLLGCEDTSYTQEVSSVFLAGLIGRIYKPGIKFDIVPVLIGPQGIGKSTVTRRLLPEFYSDTPLSFGKSPEDYRLLKKVCVVEISELQGFKKTDITLLKGFLSAQNDTYRDLYKRHKTVDRHNVFIGTGNSSAFLKDSGFERRFYPIACGICTVSEHPMEVDESYFLQVLAEAKVLFESGIPLYLTQTSIEELSAIQGEFKEEDLVSQTVHDFLDNFHIVSCWQYLTPYKRRQFYLESKGKPLDDSNEVLDSLYPTDSLVPHTSTSELAYILFNEDTSRGRTGKYASKIREVLDSREDFKVVKNKRICSQCSPTRAYVRIEAT